MKNSKKVYLKAYTRINLGDDLFIHIICNRYPDVIFYLKEHSPFTDIFSDIRNLVIIGNFDNIKFDAIVYIGGSIFIESSQSSVNRVKELKNEIIKDNIPTYIIGANFGPYTSKEYFDTVRNELLTKIKSITFRDKYSYNLFRDLKNVYYAPDVVFTLDTNKLANTKKKEIGISVIYHLERENIKKHYDEYINKLVEISKYYINREYIVKLFSFCKYEKDLVAIQDILKGLSNDEIEKVVICEYEGNVTKTLEELSNLELLIATRFHSMILGFKLNIPTIPICYSNKTRNVLEDFNIENIYTFENLNSMDYINIPRIFKLKLSYNPLNQFKELDKYIKN